MGEILLRNYQKRAEFEHSLKQTLLSLENESVKQLSKTELDTFVNEQVGYILCDLHGLVNQCHHSDTHSNVIPCHDTESSKMHSRSSLDSQSS